MAESEKLPVGTVVWAKDPAWLWWPAVIVTRAQAEAASDEKIKKETPRNNNIKYFQWNNVCDNLKNNFIQDFVEDHNKYGNNLEKLSKKWNEYKEALKKATEEAAQYILDKGTDKQKAAAARIDGFPKRG